MSALRREPREDPVRTGEESIAADERAPVRLEGLEHRKILDHLPVDGQVRGSGLGLDERGGPGLRGLGDHAGAGVAGHEALPADGAHAAREERVREQGLEVGGQGLDVAGGKEEPRLAVGHQLGVPADVRRDDGQAASHVLQHRVREALGFRAEHAHVGVLQVRHRVAGRE